MMDWRRRSAQAEMMDDPALSQEAFEACLRSLERVNIGTLAYRPTLRWLTGLGLTRGETISIMDIGSGGGDMLRRIAAWGDRRGVRFDLLGIDLNPWAKTLAEARRPADAPMRFETCDLFNLPPEQKSDLIVSSLFTHHLSDAQLVDFLRWMEARATRGWFVNDLHRHPIPYHFIRHATALLRMNPIVRHDAPVSVARAFRRRDWVRLLAEAGLPKGAARIIWHFPFRYGVERVK